MYWHTKWCNAYFSTYKNVKLENIISSNNTINWFSLILITHEWVPPRSTQIILFVNNSACSLEFTLNISVFRCYHYDADHVLLEILFQTVGALTIKASDDRDSLIVSLINRSLSDKRISLTGWYSLPLYSITQSLNLADAETWMESNSQQILRARMLSQNYFTTIICNMGLLGAFNTIISEFTDFFILGNIRRR